jgi:hypothetical protein
MSESSEVETEPTVSSVIEVGSRTITITALEDTQEQIELFTENLNSGHFDTHKNLITQVLPDFVPEQIGKVIAGLKSDGHIGMAAQLAQRLEQWRDFPNDVPVITFNDSKRSKKEEWQTVGIVSPSRFLIEGFLDNGTEIPFLVTLQHSANPRKKNDYIVRIVSIEAVDYGYLTAGLVRHIALDAIRDECLRLSSLLITFEPSKKDEREKVVAITAGASVASAREWALALTGKSVKHWSSPEVLQAVARLHSECTKRNRAQWIAEQLELEGFRSTRGDPFLVTTVRSQIRDARLAGLIEPITRKQATK